MENFLHMMPYPGPNKNSKFKDLTLRLYKRDVYNPTEEWVELWVPAFLQVPGQASGV